MSFRDTRGHYRTKSLFIEMESEYGEPMFTLSKPREGLIDGKGTFIELGDPSGYLWAVKYLESYQHFERLMQAGWFQKHFDTWVRELHAKTRAEALDNIRNIALMSESDVQRLSASKYLAERPYEISDLKKEGTKRGRPSKAELKGELKKYAKVSEQTREEFERVDLQLLKGGKK